MNLIIGLSSSSVLMLLRAKVVWSESVSQHKTSMQVRQVNYNWELYCFFLLSVSYVYIWDAFVCVSKYLMLDFFFHYLYLKEMYQEMDCLATIFVCFASFFF